MFSPPFEIVGEISPSIKQCGLTAENSVLESCSRKWAIVALELWTPVALTRTLFLLLAVTVSTIAAGVPAPYEQVRGLVWVVHDLDSTVSKLQAFGLTEVHRSTPNKVDETFRGTPVSANFQHASARFGAFSVDFVQPGSSQDAFSEFLKQHGDGIFALVSSVPSDDSLKNQARKMKDAGVSILEQVTLGGTSLTFFDTEPKGRYVIGLTTAPNLDATSGDPHVTHACIAIEGSASGLRVLAIARMGAADYCPCDSSRGLPLSWAAPSAFFRRCLAPPPFAHN